MTSKQKARPLLVETHFGDDVAEYDEHLSRYFVETSSFLDIVNDSADLILGEKGSGKSAIFRHLADENAEIPALDDVDIVPAFNIQGSVIFRRLSGRNQLPEDGYRFVWFTFMIAMVANHLVATYHDVADVAALDKLLCRAELKVDDVSARGLWDKIEALIDAIANRIEVEGELEFSIPKLPVKARTKARLRAADPHSATDSEDVDLEQVLYRCDELLSSLGRRCWVIFDRLDEAFEHDRDLERMALRSLLRAHLDLASFGLSVRSKLFLRSDVMDRITKTAGFVNATHLRRHHLNWDAESIIDLVARRIASNHATTEFFGITPNGLSTHARRIKICNLILPEAIETTRLIDWLELILGSLNPRNVISLLKFARHHQLAIYDRDDPDYSARRPLIEEQAMWRAYEELSKARLEDTVLAEFQELRPIIERLRNKPSRLARSDLEDIVGAKSGTAAYDATLELLLDVGVVSKASGSARTISRLYRPALHMTRLKADLGIAQQTDLREIVDAAIRNGPTYRTKFLPRMDATERKFVHDYVARRYPEYLTNSSDADRFGLKRIAISFRRRTRRAGGRERGNTAQSE